MNSAFGIDHGYDEVSKMGIPGFSRIGAAIAEKTLGATKVLGRGAGKQLSAGKAPGLSGSLHRVGGEAGIKLGQGAKKLGTGMAKKPSLTGKLAVGGGAAGVGAGASSLHRKRY